MIGIVFGSAAPARAFYWYEWPGGRLRPPPTIVAPPDWPENPPVVPPVTPPPVGPPVLPPGGVVPEPGTVVAAIIGLGTSVAAWGFRNLRLYRRGHSGMTVETKLD